MTTTFMKLEKANAVVEAGKASMGNNLTELTCYVYLFQGQDFSPLNLINVQAFA
ncbi:hypothetical protein YC2023_037362 [Brassica napus]